MSDFYINPSEFKHPIIIERVTKVKDEDNILKDKWIKLCNARAKILYTRGNEYVENYGTNSNVGVTFYIRYNHKDITSKDRIVYKGRNHNIIYVNNVQELNKYYEIRAEVIE
ncbi:MAG: phage head closure protein [Clostridium sp.]|nr:phage head closure protein [Clostridium sp.]